MQYYTRPPKANQYVLDPRTQTNQVNYDDYAHKAVQPGPVLSAKSGKFYQPFNN